MAPRCPKKHPQKRDKPDITIRHDKVRRYKRYHHEFVSYKEICNHLEELCDNNCSNMHLVTIGESRGGRTIFLVVVAKNLLQPRLSTLIEAGSNGSELYTVAGALYFIDHLVKDKNALMTMDYYIIPCLNPDAYEFAVQKLYTPPVCKRKKQKRICLQRGAKMDISTNFPLLNAQRIKMYDPEVVSLYRVLETFKGCIRMYISLREEGRYILYPWGTSLCPPADSEDLKKVAISGQKRGARCLAVGSIADQKKIMNGTAVDYVKFFHDPIKFVYSVHINEKHAADEKEILAMGDEVCKIIKGMSTAVLKYYLGQRGPIVVKQTVKNYDSVVSSGFL